MDNITEVVIRLAKQVEEHEIQIRELLDAQVSMQKWLTVAFREAGFDFQKISRTESSRRQQTVLENTNIELQTEETDPNVQDELAKEILKSLEQQDGAIRQINSIAGVKLDPRVGLTTASNQGRKE